MQPLRQSQTRSADRVRTVSEVNAEARFLIEERFRRLWIEGEVSDFRPYASGHWYFSLQDDKAQIRCVMFSSANRFARFKPANGLSVLVRCRLSIYEGRGQFQAIVDHIEPAGEGALRAAFERLKSKLDTEGLFAEDRKRPLPPYPRHIGIISSPAGAALRDVLAVLRRRFPCVRVTCFQVAVQGFEAEGQIVSAFDRAEFMRHPPDVIVLTRGGGSLEDLAVFNRESVARRIAACELPVVSAIGHETDVTIADFVADKRAPTPSAAAEMATPDRLELEERIRRITSTMVSRTVTQVRADSRLLATVRRRLVHPGRTLEQRMQRADELADRLSNATTARLTRARTAVAHQAQLLARSNPRVGIGQSRERVARARSRLGIAGESFRGRVASRVAALARALNAVSPLATLDRGFAIVAKPDGSAWGRPVVSVDDAQPGDVVEAHLSDGSLQATVSSSEKRP